MAPDYAHILGRIAGLKPGPGGNLYGRCPVAANHKHGDRRPSLSVKVCAESGRLVAWCGRGCTFAEIASALGTEPAEWFPDYREKVNKQRRKAPMSERFEATYDYTDEAGNLLYQVVRLPGKDFRQRRPVPGQNGQWVWSIGGGYVWNYGGQWRIDNKRPCPDAVEVNPVRQVPYRLHEMAAHENWSAVVVEGEKDVLNLLDVLKGQPIVVTCNSGGAGKWRRSFGGYLAGRRVAVIPDNDEPGLDHAMAVAASALMYGCKAVRVVRWPAGTPEGYDVSDWLKERHGKATAKERRDAVLALVNSADVYEPKLAGVAA